MHKMINSPNFIAGLLVASEISVHDTNTYSYFTGYKY